MTTVSTPPPPPAPEPATTDFNKWADYWYYTIGVNVIPSDTKNKTTHEKWSQWQTDPVPQEVFEEWKRSGAFKDGLANIAGRVWRGEHAGKYFVFIDLDNLKAINEFCAMFSSKPTLEQLASKFVVEQHLDDKTKAHVYLYSEIPFIKKSSDVIKSPRGEEKQKKPTDKDIPLFEVKGDGPHGIAYCTPSLHKNGRQYEIIGTTQPVTLTKDQAEDTMKRLNEICKRYNLHYLSNDGQDFKNETGKVPVEELVEEGAMILQGNNRHNGLVQIGMSIYSYLRGKYPLSTIKKFILIANQIYCSPPLDEEEFEKNVWRSIVKYIPPNAELEALAIRNLKKIEASSGVDPNDVNERPLQDVTRYNSGEWTIPRVKIIGVSPSFKMISSVTIKCDKCGDEKVEDYSDMPLMSYKAPTKIRCAVCNAASDVIVAFDHVEAQSVTTQDAEDIRDDLKRLHVILLDDLTRNIRIGETATITGEITVLNPSGQGGKKATTAMYARQVKYEREEESPITDEDIALFEKFVAEHGVNTPDELVKMFAPQVIGHEDAKLGLLRSAVCIRENKPVAGLRTRVHTDLAGDFGTAKSTLADNIVKVVPNSRFVTAQHISIKSVLAIIDKDPDGGKMLMLGAVPQARNALCVLNEMGSMLFEDQQHLADILEEGRFTIDKHGIYQPIESPTTIIATTNPEGSKWSGTPSLDQIPIKANIKDRFDQTYTFENFRSQDERRNYASKKSTNYQKPEDVEPDYTFLKRFLQHAALIPDPKLTPEAAKILEDFWVTMSDEGYTSNRGFDSLIRIAKGQARLQLKTEIDVEIALQTIDDVERMLHKLGKYEDPTARNPIDIAYNEAIKYAHTLQAPITLEEAIKYAAFSNNDVKQYLGGNGAKYSTRENRRYRHIHDRFADGAEVGQVKAGRDGLSVVIYKLKPLTIDKVVKEENPSLVSHASHANNSTEQSGRGMSTSDTRDASGAFFSGQELKIHAILKTLLNDKETFTEDDWEYQCSIWPNLGWSIDQAKQALRQLLRQGKIMELEGGNYKPTQKLSNSGGS